MDEELKPVGAPQEEQAPETTASVLKGLLDAGISKEEILQVLEELTNEHEGDEDLDKVFGI